MQVLILSFEDSLASAFFDFDATVEVNEFSEPVAAEIFGIAAILGAGQCAQVVEFLRTRVPRISYDPEVDALSFSFGEGARSGGQINGTLQIGLCAETIAAIKLFNV